MNGDTNSEVSSMSSCTGALEELDIVVENPVREAMLLANRCNREAVGYLEQGMEKEAWEHLEHASKQALELLRYTVQPADANRGNPQAAAAHPLNLIVTSLHGSSELFDSAYVLRTVFLLDDCFLNKEALVAVIMYNLAYLLHIRGVNNRTVLWKQTRDLQRAAQLYSLVRKLSETTLRLEVPVLSMAVLNNLGHVHHVQQDYAETSECWSALASLLNNLPSDFSMLNVRFIRQNIQLKDRIDASTQPQKKRRAV
jgi:tetratricopeptide (TPR) repeat protein